MTHTSFVALQSGAVPPGIGLGTADSHSTTRIIVIH